MIDTLNLCLILTGSQLIIGIERYIIPYLTRPQYHSILRYIEGFMCLIALHLAIRSPFIDWLVTLLTGLLTLSYIVRAYQLENHNRYYQRLEEKMVEHFGVPEIKDIETCPMGLDCKQMGRLDKGCENFMTCFRNSY